MNVSRIVACFVVSSLAVAPTTSVCAAEVSPQLMAYACKTCHSGATIAIPSIQELSKQQIETAVLDFKYQRRQGTIMDRLAKGLTDTEIRSVAQYLVQFPY